MRGGGHPSNKLLKGFSHVLTGLKENGLSKKHLLKDQYIGKKFKNPAFTMAEVLITLGIIGIIASMTLPALVSKYKHKEYSARIKKFNSMMMQAIMLSEAVNGDSKYWTHKSGAYTNENGVGVYDPVKGPEYTYEFIMTYIEPYIKYHRIEQSVKPDYSGEMMVAIYLTDGSIAYVKSAGCIDFNLDVNGDKKPNKRDYDTFVFALCPWNSTGYFDHKIKKWGALCSSSTNRNDREALIKEKRCGSRILELSDWEFTDDYPFRL
ncbi:hypothetical protein DBY21_06990 [Candidatus Gastranaerophilales bacterium]|nr:MAG: hypothetical protein DBY21_06990 [Candidatus Gastranaerophilales bacterium]